MEKQELGELLLKYFEKDFTYKEIQQILSSKHDTDLSLRTIKRRIRSLGLKRKNVAESSLDDVCFAIIKEINSAGYNLGYRAMWHKLKREYNLVVKRDTVYELLKLADPDGVANRYGNKLRRRKYLSPGPNWIWHLDGYDKLKQFGFAIHGCVDGFSRYILWLEVANTNNNPNVISHYFLHTLAHHGFSSNIIRSDKGTENSSIRLIQMTLRNDHNDAHSGSKSFIQGKSTRNQRIESYWGRMRQHSMDFYIQFFKRTQAEGLFDGSAIHVQCLQYCFGPLIKYELYSTRQLWNEHKIRKQAARNNICGKPYVLFHAPQEVGMQDYKRDVSAVEVQRLIQGVTQQPKLRTDNFCELVNLLLPDHRVPADDDEALAMYLDLVRLIEENE